MSPLRHHIPPGSSNGWALPWQDWTSGDLIWIQNPDDLLSDDLPGAHLHVITWQMKLQKLSPWVTQKIEKLEVFSCFCSLQVCSSIWFQASSCCWLLLGLQALLLRHQQDVTSLNVALGTCGNRDARTREPIIWRESLDRVETIAHDSCLMLAKPTHCVGSLL